MRVVSVMHEADGFGLDRVSVSFPVSSWEKDSAAWSNVAVRAAGTSARVLGWAGSAGPPESSVFVGVQDAGGAPGVWAKLEWNPSRFTGSWPRPSNVCEMRDTTEIVTALASGLVTPAVPLDEYRVKRLDVARDFDGVGRPDRYVQGLRTAHRPWARRSFVYSDPKRNRAETLFVGSGAGGCRLYDKHAETDSVPEGRVRWEVEARAAWLGRYAGVSTVGDVEAASVLRLAKDRWKWSAMGVEVAGGATLVAKVRGSGLSPAAGRAFLGWLLEAAYGDEPSASSKTVAKYRALARELGIAVASDAFVDAGVALTARLDFDRGAEVLTVAA